LNYIVSNKLPEDITCFQTDKVKLESIITNLIKNAIKFTSHGSVEFGCCLKKPNLVFYVKDTGAGIPVEDRERIFDRFVQADVSNSRPHEGSGLGLSIVKAYVEMLNGKINVDSKVGTGSCFSVSLPFIRGEKSEMTRQQAYFIPESSTARFTILIAEDDLASYTYLENLLTGNEVSCLRTTNGADTVRFVRENSDISLVLMDLKMPGMSGIEAVRLIREFNKSIPVIAQTAYALSGDREIALEAGCNDYITKPINRNDLQEIVSRYIGRKKN